MSRNSEVSSKNIVASEYDTFLARSPEKKLVAFVTMTRIRKILSQNDRLGNGDERNRLLKTDDQRANVGGNGRLGKRENTRSLHMKRRIRKCDAFAHDRNTDLPLKQGEKGI